MDKQLRYYFNYVDTCNMCQSTAASHRILGKRLNRSQGRNPEKKTGITTTVVKCENCGLIFTNPQPIPFDIQDHYGIPPEDYWQEIYFKVDPDYFTYTINRFKPLLNFREGMKSLDIGAGLGKAMIAMTKAGFDTYGFEPSNPFYKRAIEKMGISPDRLRLGMLEEMQYEANSFDFISFGAVLEHLYDPSSSIIKALSWLKPNGIIHIEVPSSKWLVNRLVNFYYSITGSDYVANTSPMHEPFHLYEFGLSSFEQHAKKHGYEIAFYEYFVCNTYLPKFADFILKSIMARTNTGEQLSIYLRKK